MNEIILPCSLSIGSDDYEIECKVQYERTEDGVTVERVYLDGEPIALTEAIVSSLEEEIKSLH